MSLDMAELQRMQSSGGDDVNELPLEFFQKAPVQLIAEKGEVPACFLRTNKVVSSPRTATEAEVPVIDISGYLTGDEQAKQQVRAQLASACEKWGFFQVVNHGIDPSVMEQGMEVVRQFYALPLEEKLKCAVKQPGCNFAGYGRFNIRPRERELEWRDFFFHHHDKYHGPEEGHEWPKTPADYREKIVKWQADVEKLGSVLLTIMSENLGLPSTYLGDLCHIASGATNYYPPCSRPADVIGLNAHADASALNILQETLGVPGLQIHHKGEWLTIKSVPGALIVNAGDVVEIISNGRYESVLHRGIVSSVGDRISLLVGLRPELDSVLVPHPTKGEPLQYRAVTYQEYLSYRGQFIEGKHQLDSLRLDAATGAAGA